MARSYKHYPCIKDYSENNTHYNKQMANKILRKLPMYVSVPSGGAYKKYYDSWNIHDYRFLLRISKEHYDIWKLTHVYYNDQDYDSYRRTYIKK